MYVWFLGAALVYFLAGLLVQVVRESRSVALVCCLVVLVLFTLAGGATLTVQGVLVGVDGYVPRD